MTAWAGNGFALLVPAVACSVAMFASTASLAEAGKPSRAPDGIRYFETHPQSAARKFLFVRVGQDTPLFDEQSLELVAPSR